MSFDPSFMFLSRATCLSSSRSSEFPVSRQEFPVFPRNRVLTPNVSIYHKIKPRRRTEMGQIGAIFNNSLLNSLLAANCGAKLEKSNKIIKSNVDERTAFFGVLAGYRAGAYRRAECQAGSYVAGKRVRSEQCASAAWERSAPRCAESRLTKGLRGGKFVPVTGHPGRQLWLRSWAIGLNRSRGSLRQAENPTLSSPTP